MFPSKVSCYSNSTSTTSTATTAPGHYHDHHHHSPPADADNEHIRSHHFSTITSNGLPTDSGTLGPSLRRRRPEPPAVTVDSPPQTPPTSESAPYRQPRWSIPVPTPFEYEDCDEDDFRGYFDFDKAWVGAPATTTTTTTTTLLPPPSSASYGLPPTPQNDQEYYDIMYKLDLGVESPYLGTSYQESFPASVLEEPDQKRGNVGRCDNEPEVGDKQVDCALCLKKAVSPCRTKCCDRLLCREHVTKGPHSQDSSNLCPCCNSPCIFPPTLFLDTNKTSGRSRSSSLSRSRSSTTSSDVSTSSGGTTSIDSDLSAWPSPGSEAEDTWDIKSSWKKSDGGSLDLAEMVRDAIRESMKFVGLSGSGRIAASPVEALVVERIEADEVGEVGVPMRVVSVLGLVLILFVLFR